MRMNQSGEQLGSSALFLMSKKSRSLCRARQWHFNFNLWWKSRKRGVPLGRLTRWFVSFSTLLLFAVFGMLLMCAAALVCDHNHAQNGSSRAKCVVNKTLNIFSSQKFAVWLFKPDLAGIFVCFFLARRWLSDTSSSHSYDCLEWVTWIKTERESEKRGFIKLMALFVREFVFWGFFERYFSRLFFMEISD